MKAHHIFLAAALLALASCDGISASKETTKSTVYDTLIFPDDTTQQIVTSHLEDGNVVSRDTSRVQPITQFVWFANHYQDTVILEAWTGSDLEWRNGTVLGHGLTALPDPNARSTPLAPNARRRLSPRMQPELLLIAGLPDTASTVPNLLNSRRFVDIHPGDTIVLDTQGLLQLR